MLTDPLRSPLYEFLDANRDAVLDAVVTRIDSVRGATATSREEILVLGGFLDELRWALAGNARSSAPPPPAPREPPSESARQHGRAGYAGGKTVAQVVHDYATVGDVVTDLAKEAGLELTLDDAQVLNRWMDHGIADALAEYFSASSSGSARRVGEIARALGNALGSVSMAFELIRAGSASPAGRVADIVDSGLSSIAHLTSRLAADVRLRADPEPKLARLRLTAFLGRMIEGSVPERGMQISLAVGGDPVVVADERHLEAAFENLIQNAIKYSRNDGHVEVRAWSDGERVHVHIEDECGGLPDGDPEDLFVPFSPRRTDRAGLGLGLGIARRAAELHGGSLRARGLPGKGCVFEMQLPLRVSHAAR